MEDRPFDEFIVPIACDPASPELPAPLPFDEWIQTYEPAYEYESDNFSARRVCYVDDCYTIRFSEGVDVQPQGWFCSIWGIGADGLASEDVRTAGATTPEYAYETLLMSIDAIRSGYSLLDI